MSLYSRHLIPREKKQFPSRKQGFGFFYDSPWMPVVEKGFWYRGCEERIVIWYRAYHRMVWKKFAESMMTQIYNTSPLTLELLADAEEA